MANGQLLVKCMAVKVIKWSQQTYKDLAWAGLDETAIMNTLFPYGSDDRIRINNRNDAEDYQQPFYQAPVVGTPCD